MEWVSTSSRSGRQASFSALPFQFLHDLCVHFELNERTVCWLGIFILFLEHFFPLIRLKSMPLEITCCQAQQMKLDSLAINCIMASRDSTARDDLTSSVFLCVCVCVCMCWCFPSCSSSSWNREGAAVFCTCLEAPSLGAARVFLCKRGLM